MRCHARHYEPGAFNLRPTPPRPTALVSLFQELAAGRRPSHPSVAEPGWWRRPTRLLYPPVAAFSAQEYSRQPQSIAGGPTRPILITGATGTLGRAFARLCESRGLSHRLVSRAEMDIADPHSVEAALERYKPWALVNTAGYVRVDDAEREPDRCRRENTDGPEVLAAACANRAIGLLTFSSDLVFDGKLTEPYREGHRPAPLNVYGHTKAEAERTRLGDLSRGAGGAHPARFFGPWDRFNFVAAVLRTLSLGEPFVAPDDAVISPTYVPDLVHASLDLLIDRAGGLWHLANTGTVSWYDLAREAASTARLDPGPLVGVPTGPGPAGTPAALQRTRQRSRTSTPRARQCAGPLCRECEIDWRTPGSTIATGTSQPLFSSHNAAVLNGSA